MDEKFPGNACLARFRRVSGVVERECDGAFSGVANYSDGMEDVHGDAGGLSDG